VFSSLLLATIFTADTARDSDAMKTDLWIVHSCFPSSFNGTCSSYCVEAEHSQHHGSRNGNAYKTGVCETWGRSNRVIHCWRHNCDAHSLATFTACRSSSWRSLGSPSRQRQWGECFSSAPYKVTPWAARCRASRLAPRTPMRSGTSRSQLHQRRLASPVNRDPRYDTILSTFTHTHTRTHAPTHTHTHTLVLSLGSAHPLTRSAPMHAAQADRRAGP
jgi:hypothetical protein